MKKNILIVAGGTGGHIWPAISFGKWIDSNKTDFKVHYVSGSRSIEEEIYSSVNLEPTVLRTDGSPLSGVNISQKLHRLLALFTGVFHAKKIIKKYKPVICILFAGYISIPFIIICKIFKIPVILHEQNAYAGKSTRIAKAFGVEVFTGWGECNPLKAGSYIPVGVPVRTFKKHKPADAWKMLNMKKDMPNGIKVVVFSGTLGSVSLKDLICELSKKEKYKNWTFILPSAADEVSLVDSNVYLLPRIWNAALLYSLADIVVTRAGASTLTELGTLGIPAVVVPWGKATDNHQFYNASVYTAENAAVIWNEKSDVADFEKKLEKIYKIFTDPVKKNNSKLYNKTNEIYESFWFALSLKIERSAIFGPE